MICKNCNLSVPSGSYCLLCGWNQRKEPQQNTLKAIHDRWILRKRYRNLSKSGKAGYDTAWLKHLAPFENYQIAKLDLDTYQAILDDMVEQGLSLSSQQKVQQLISQLSKLAIAEGLLLTNPAPELVLEGREARETKPFEDGQIQALIRCANDVGARYVKAARITLCLVFTGYRPEELFSIRKQDCNPKESFLVAGSKTNAGKNRVVPVMDIVAPYLAEWYLACPAADSYLIRNSRGGRMDLRNWRTREFYPMTLELGINQIDQLTAKKKLPHITPYSARHTFATLAWRADVDSTALTKMIGHAKLTTTTRFYIHKDYEKMRAEALKIESYWYSQVV